MRPWLTPSHQGANQFDYLPSLKTRAAASTRDELDSYLATGPVSVDDPIAWWRDHEDLYPRLSRMAIDYLTIPGTSLVHPRSVRKLTRDFPL